MQDLNEDRSESAENNKQPTDSKIKGFEDAIKNLQEDVDWVINLNRKQEMTLQGVQTTVDTHEKIFKELQALKKQNLEDSEPVHLPSKSSDAAQQPPVTVINYKLASTESYQQTSRILSPSRSRKDMATQVWFGTRQQLGTLQQPKAQQQPKTQHRPDARQQPDVQRQLKIDRQPEAQLQPAITKKYDKQGKMDYILYVNCICKWPECDAPIGTYDAFRQHLKTVHALNVKSVTQVRAQIKRVGQLAVQLKRERDRLTAVMRHLHKGRGIRPQTKRRKPPIPNNQRKRPQPSRPSLVEAEMLDREYYKTSNVRPPASYESLIRQAILESPNKQLSLNEIYYWFETTFRYYFANPGKWKNSIRHYLTCTKSFKRMGDGYGVWTVDEAEYQKRRRIGQDTAVYRPYTADYTSKAPPNVTVSDCNPSCQDNIVDLTSDKEDDRPKIDVFDIEFDELNNEHDSDINTNNEDEINSIEDEYNFEGGEDTYDAAADDNDIKPDVDLKIETEDVNDTSDAKPDVNTVETKPNLNAIEPDFMILDEDSDTVTIYYG